jgi:large repetitive protein
MAPMIGNAGILGGWVYGSLRVGLELEYLFATDASDTSGNGYDGTLQGDANVTGGSLVLDGSGDYMTAASAAIGGGAISISMWVNMTDATAFRMLAKWGNSPTGNQFIFGTGGTDVLRLYFYDASSDTIRIGRETLALTADEGIWVYLVGTYDGGSSSAGIHIYRNATPIDTADFNSGSFSSYGSKSQTVEIGSLIALGSTANGKIDDVRIYDRVLSAAEIATLYNLRPDLH